MKLIVFVFLVCFALCAFALPAEDETIGSFDEVDDEFDPKNPAAIIKKLKKLKKKLLG